MAKRQRDEGENIDSGNEPGADADMAPLPDDFAGLDVPGDFKPLGLSGPQAWVIKQKGVRVRGMLLSRFQKRGKSAKKGFGYQIKLTAGPVRCMLNQEEADVGKGGFVCIDESKAVEELKALADGVERGGEFEVIIDYGAQRELEDGNSFWPARVVFKTVKQPTSNVAARAAAIGTNGAGASSDDIPFG